MSNGFLSQEEIDSLLNGSGGDPSPDLGSNDEEIIKDQPQQLYHK